MSGREYRSPLTRAEYEEGRERRLYPADILPTTWYTLAHLGHPIDQMSCYAMELLVETISIRPVDDLYVVEAYLLDADGSRVDDGKDLLKADGLLVRPAEPGAEGYFLGVDEKLGLGPLAVNDTVLLAR